MKTLLVPIAFIILFLLAMLLGLTWLQIGALVLFCIVVYLLYRNRVQHGKEKEKIVRDPKSSVVASQKLELYDWVKYAHHSTIYRVVDFRDNGRVIIEEALNPFVKITEEESNLVRLPRSYYQTLD